MTKSTDSLHSSVRKIFLKSIEPKLNVDSRKIAFYFIVLVDLEEIIQSTVILK